jgi:hypothetical protein
VAGEVTSSVHEERMALRFFMVNAGPVIFPPTFSEWAVVSMVIVGSQVSALASLVAIWTEKAVEQGRAPPAPEPGTLSTVQIVLPKASLSTNL